MLNVEAGRCATQSDDRPNPEKAMTKRELVEYEVAGSAWANIVSLWWMQDLVTKYYARKVERKYARWVRSQQMRAESKANGDL